MSADQLDRFVLAIAGAPASGKTTVARAVATHTGGRRVSFGDLVRAEARRRGCSLDRGALQRLGQQLLDDVGPEAFCRAALRAAGSSVEDRPVIWDGIRHLRVLTALRSLYDVHVLLIYLRPPDAARRQRFAREAGSRKELARLEAHATEREAKRLFEAADLVCTAATTDAAFKETLELLAPP